MKKKIKPIDLTETIDKLLKEYGEDVYEVMCDSIKEVSKEAMNDLKAVRKFSPNGQPSGAYSKSWDVERIQVTRFSVEDIVYNEDHYRLTHLLENGHALKRGGRTYGSVRAYEHIKPVNDAAQEKLIRQVESRISNI